VVSVVHDAGPSLPRRGLFKSHGIITVRIGKPVDAAGPDPSDIDREAQDWIEAQIATPAM
jgi:1-acyl-sn-glycerol-3-phosphate acyltransferase